MENSQRQYSFSWLFRWRTAGVILFVLALLATLLAVVHLVENRRGKRKWDTYKQQLTTQGVKLDLAAFVPPPIPDEKNFAATPFFSELLPGPRPTNWSRWPSTINNLRPHLTRRKRNERQLTDLVAWQLALRAQNRGDTNEITSLVGSTDPTVRARAAEEILSAMKVYEPVFQELRAAGERPLSRYDVRYDLQNPWGILLPHLSVIKEVAQVLGLKACSELAAGKGEEAMQDVRLMVRLVDSMNSELFLISYLVRVACLQILQQPVWEGLALDRWSDAQLEELQQMMLKFNFVAELTTPLGAEQASGILTADVLLRQRDKADFLNALMGPGGTMVRSGVGNVLASLVPRGWYHMEKFNYTRLFQEFVLPGFDGANRVIYPGVSDRNEAQLDRVLRESGNAILSHHVLAKLCAPAVGKTQRKAAYAQTVVHQAAIACALERYRRANGAYPASLNELEPRFIKSIPRDAIGGKPMRYKAAAPIVLYSVGWDEKDNDGTPGKTQWDDQGDWVWTYPVKD